MGTRAVLQVFERYQKERVAFVSAVAEISKSPQVRDSACHFLSPLRLAKASLADKLLAAECRSLAAGWSHGPAVPRCVTSEVFNT